MRPAFGDWRSLVAHFVRDEGVGGSNPLSPTKFEKPAQRAGFFASAAHEDENLFLMEVLYTIFIRATCEVKPVEKRVRELQAARKDTDISVPVPLKSVLAPESIDLTRGSYVVMDGVYHAYLIVPSDGYNPRVVAGWTSILVNAGEGIDVDFFFSREPKERIQAKLGQQNRINRRRLKDTSDKNTDLDDY